MTSVKGVAGERLASVFTLGLATTLWLPKGGCWRVRGEEL